MANPVKKNTLDVKTWTSSVVGIIVAVIVTVSVFVPIIDDSNAEYTTFTNDGYFHAKEISASDTTVYTIMYGQTASGAWTFTTNDESTQSITSSGYTIVTLDSSYLFRTAGGTPSSSVEFTSLFPYSTADPSNSTIAVYRSMVFDHGTMTATLYSNDTVTYTYSIAIIPTTEGDLVMTNTAVYDVTLAKDSTVIGFGQGAWTYNSTSYTLISRITGSIADGITLQSWTAADSVTSTTPVISYTDNGDNSYTFNAVRWTNTYTVGDASGSQNIFYNRIFVPAEVTIMTHEGVEGPVASLINVLPMLVVVGIVMAAIGMFAVSRGSGAR